MGRHVALDKLIGMRAMKKWGPTVVFLSSRASYEMVQKAGSDRNRNSFCDFRTDESSTPFSKKMRSDVVRILPRQSSKYLQRSGKTAESLKI